MQQIILNHVLGKIVGDFITSCKYSYLKLKVL